MKKGLVLFFLGGIYSQFLFAGPSSNSWTDEVTASIHPLCLDPISVILGNVSAVNKGLAIELEKSAPKSNHVSISRIVEVNKTNSLVDSESFRTIRLKGELTVVEFIDQFIPFLFRKKSWEKWMSLSTSIRKEN